MSLQWAALLALAIVGLLFVVAAAVERRVDRLHQRSGLRRFAYTLSLGVYCTSWTFYGSVGSAVRDGWTYLPIYLAPVLLLLLAPRFLTLLARAMAAEQASTVSDFIAARFGHDVVVARLVTIIALLGTIPYIALQFRSIGSALSIASGSVVTVPSMIATALLLAVFAILFGARRYELAGRSEGLVYAIGLESLIKLVALVLVAAIAAMAVLGAPAAKLAPGLGFLAKGFRPEALTPDFPVVMVISAMAIIALPRQFYMSLVEAQQPDDFVRARIGLAGYLAAMALLVLPIALAGTMLLGQHVEADLYVLALPAATGHNWVLGAALVGGFSAASAMAIVDAIALATMVSNDLIFPTIIRSAASTAAGSIGRRMLLVRRISILAIMALALAWDLLISPTRSLASFGLVAFAAMAQFTPHLILAANGRGRDPMAARASLLTGLLLWLYTLALPPILPVHWLAALSGGPLDPLRLFRIDLGSPLVHGVIWSLGANLVVMGVVAAGKASAPPLFNPIRSGRRVTNVAEIAELTASFVGKERVDREFPAAMRSLPIDRKAVHRAQELIATVVGASSARALVVSALAGGQMNLAEVAQLLDRGSQSLRFSRALLAATFENIDAGISVVDAELNLVAWNSRYLDLFDYPPGFVTVGKPVADLIRHNAQRGDFGPGDVEFHVEKRLGHLRRRLEHSFERRRRDGRVIKTVGGPMPSGGYVMSFTDITEEARVRSELERTLAGLEARVTERTQALSAANRQLAAASRDKTRFLAAASHDLLQPLHAARLFTAALARDTPMSAQGLIDRVDGSIVAAETLLRALLDISKLDAGGVQPAPERVPLAPFLTDLVEGLRPKAEKRGLQLRYGSLLGEVHTDPGLLRSVLQNFVVNALRYTPAGGVLVGVRQRGPRLRIDVIDTGVGIEPGQVDVIFDEFTRLGQVDEDGLGLGLAMAQRIVRLLDGEIEVRSRPGHGSRFSLLLAGQAASKTIAPILSARRVAPPGASQGFLTVMVIDNDLRTVEATTALLTSLGHCAIGVMDMAAALADCSEIAALVADFRLDHGEDGLTVIEKVRELRPNLPAMLITAEPTAPIRQRAAGMGVQVLAKPVAPSAIEAFLAGVSVLEVEPQ
jgi:Na+/proline symporter/signal transduction histidine kinase